MGAILYLYQRAFINRFKKALKKPVTYIYIILGGLYVGMVVFGFGTMASEFGVDNARGLVSILTFMIFFLMPANIISYTKRKGLIYKPCDVHFVFTAPLSGKQVLIYAFIKSLLITFLLGVGLAIGGTIWFHVAPWKMLLYFLYGSIIENILETSIMILLYGNEKLSEKTMKLFPVISYLLMAAFFVIGFLYLKQNGLSMNTAIDFLFLPAIQLVPVIGWSIGIVHLIFVGPSLISIIASSLYLLSAAGLAFAAYKMKCTGQFYEDAMKFADDYEEARNRGKKGEVALIGKKAKFNKAKIEYKGYYAKAIFYRQLLEYKKSKFFIFGINTIISLLISVGIILLMHFGDGAKEFGDIKEFVIPGVMAYVAFLTSGYATKWSKELANPYTYLMPDTAFKKLWYATLMEHIRSAVDGCLIAIPAGIYMGINPVQILLAICMFVCLQAIKLYLTVFAEGVLGNLLGTAGRQIMRMVIFSSLIGIGVAGAVIGTIFINIVAGYLIMLVISVILTFACMVVASNIFEKMEAVA